MAYQPIVRELFRSLETIIHERFAMIEDIIRIESQKNVTSLNDVEDISPLSEKISSLAETIEQLSSRLTALEGVQTPPETVHVTRMDNEAHTPVRPAALQNMFMQSMQGLTISTKNEVEEISVIEHVEEEEEEEELEEEVEEEEVEEEELEEEVEEEVEEEFEEEVEEEEALELEEFLHKGKSYYKDPSNVVYILDENGEPASVGRWDPKTSRILK